MLKSNKTNIENTIIRLAIASTTTEILNTLDKKIDKNSPFTRWQSKNGNVIKSQTKNGYGIINLFNADNNEFAFVLYSNNNKFNATIECLESDIEKNLKWFEEKYLQSLTKNSTIYQLNNGI